MEEKTKEKSNEEKRKVKQEHGRKEKREKKWMDGGFFLLVVLRVVVARLLEFLSSNMNPCVSGQTSLLSRNGFRVAAASFLSERFPRVMTSGPNMTGFMDLLRMCEDKREELRVMNIRTKEMKRKCDDARRDLAVAKTD